MTDPDFDAEVRRAAPDLWLSTRLIADLEARSGVLALYALQAELAKVASAATNPLAGEIRLAWWREEVEAMAGKGRALGHPALQALAPLPGLDRAALDAMIEARHAELDPRPFQEETALLAYLDGVDGGLMRAAASLLAPGEACTLTQTARAVGWTRLLRERAAWRARARDWAPLAWGEADEAEIGRHARHRVRDALAAARRETAAVPTAVFPAIAYAALAGAYAQGRHPSELEKRARLLWAAIMGRV